MYAWQHCPSQPVLRSVFASLLVLIFFSAAPAVAGTHWHYSLIGFSPDGRYAALEQSGTVDGIGLPDCYVELYDFDTNTRIDLKPPQTEGAERKMYSCAEAREDARAALKGYNIDKKHQGSTLALDSQPDSAGANDTATKITAMNFMYKNKACRLKLYEKSDDGNNPWGRTMIKWNVGLSCGNEKERLILPEEWSNFSVKIEEARIVGDRLVLFAATTEPDFEAPGSSTGAIGILISQAPPAGVKLDMEVLGFSDDDNYFGYWLSGADVRAKKSRAELHVFSTNNGEEVLKDSETGPENSDPKAVLVKLKERMKGKLGELKLGNDPGAEMYKSGTATKTAFKLAGSGECQLRLKADTSAGSVDEPTELLFRKPNKPERSLFSASVGFRFSLNTVRLSKSEKAFAVMLKYSLLEQGMEDRVYAVSFGRTDNRLP